MKSCGPQPTAPSCEGNLTFSSSTKSEAIFFPCWIPLSFSFCTCVNITDLEFSFYFYYSVYLLFCLSAMYVDPHFVCFGHSCFLFVNTALFHSVPMIQNVNSKEGKNENEEEKKKDSTYGFLPMFSDDKSLSLSLCLSLVVTTPVSCVWIVLSFSPIIFLCTASYYYVLCLSLKGLVVPCSYWLFHEHLKSSVPRSHHMRSVIHHTSRVLYSGVCISVMSTYELNQAQSSVLILGTSVKAKGFKSFRLFSK